MLIRRVLCLALCLGAAQPVLAQVAQPSAAAAHVASEPASIAYTSVKEALSALRAKPDVEVKNTGPDAWTLITEPNGIQWSFTPASHAAHPAVVRREIKVDAEGGVVVETTALCESAKATCDTLVGEFRELNDRMGRSIRSRIRQERPRQ